MKGVSIISKNSTSKGFMILTLANVASKVLGLIYIPFLVGTIGQEGYGTYYAAYNIYAFMFILTISGTSAAIPKLMAEYSVENKEKDAMASFKIGKIILILMGLFMMLLLFLMSKPLVGFIGYKKAYYAILALCPSLLFTSINSSYRSYFQGRNNMKPLAISQFIEQLGNTIFTILLSYIFMQYSLELGVAGGAAGTAIGALLSLTYLYIEFIKDTKEKRESIERQHTNKEIAVYMLKYSLPLILSTGLLYAGNNLIDVANIKQGLLKAGLEESYATIRYGNYGNYIQLMNVPMIIISALSISMFPLIAKANVSKDKTELSNHLKSIFKLSFLISIPAAVGLSILSTEIYYTIFGTLNNGSASIMRFGSFVIIFSALLQLTTTTLNSTGNVIQGTIAGFIGVVIKITANFILIPISYINIYGAALGLLLYNIIPMLINHRTIKKHLGTKDSLLNQWKKPAIASIIMGVVIFFTNKALNMVFSLILSQYFANTISLMITVYIGVLVYLHMIIRLNAATKEELSFIPAKAKKLMLIK